MDSIKEQEKEKSILSASIRHQLIQNIGYRLLSVLLKRVDQKSAFYQQKMQEETASMVNPLIKHFIQIVKNKLVSFLIKLVSRKNAYLQKKQNLSIQDSILSFYETSIGSPNRPG